MKYLRFPLALLLGVTLTSLSIFSITVTEAASHGQSTALERGYRTGYSDGYNAGFRDIADHATRDFQNKEEYQRADRSYNEAWGPVEDYRDGYQQGFEAGYTGGYDRKAFDSTLPTGFRKRGAPAQVNATVNARVDNPDTTATPDNSTDTSAATAAPAGNIAIPRDTILVLELQTPLSTDATQAGDRFQARVVEPRDYASAIVDGHVSQVRRPGKTKGVAQLQLSFDQIRLADNRTTSLHAQLVEVVPMGRSSEDPEVDREGGVRGQSTTKDDVAKVGAATGIGAIIGAIAGGGKGAAIGAVIGGGVGTAGVMSQRGKDIRLEQGQQLKIRTSTDTSVL